MLSSSVLTVYLLMAAFGVLGPVLLTAVWKIKTKQPFTVILIGAAVFFGFAILLESLPKLALFQTDNPVSRYVLSHAWLVTVSSALLAGLFEETGRFLAFRFLLKKRTGRRTAITCGIGHGGFEVLYLLGVTGVLYFSYSLAINNGQFEAMIARAGETSPETATALAVLPAKLAATSPVSLLLSVTERVSAVLFHLGCSVLVFASVHEKGKGFLFPLAILLHTALDLFPALYSIGLIRNVFLLEACLLAFSVLFFTVVLKRVYRRLPEEGETTLPPAPEDAAPSEEQAE